MVLSTAANHPTRSELGSPTY